MGEGYERWTPVSRFMILSSHKSYLYGPFTTKITVSFSFVLLSVAVPLEFGSGDFFLPYSCQLMSSFLQRRKVVPFSFHYKEQCKT